MVKNKIITLKLWVRILIMIFIIAILLTGILNILNARKIKKIDDIVKLTYKENNDVDFKVYYRENDFYKEPYYGKDNQYVGELIDNIDIDYIYQLFLSEKADVTYTYSVKTKLVGNYETTSDNKNSPGLLKKEKKLMGETIVQKNIKDIDFTKNIKFNYQDYNNIISEYKKQLNIPITAYVEVSFVVMLHAEVGDEVINDESHSTLKIPLNQKAFGITIDSTDPFTEQITKKAEQTGINYFKQSFGIVLIVASILVFILTFKIIFVPKYHTYYKKELDRLLRTYGDIIIEIINPISDEGMDVIYVKNFNEILDLEEELRIPINFVEIESGKTGEFSIVHENIVYKYILTNEKED